MRLAKLLELMFPNLDHWSGQEVLFRVDAGRVPGLSFGHLARCGILAKGLDRFFNVGSRMVMHGGYADGVDHAKNLGLRVVVADSLSKAKAGENVRAVVIDLPSGPKPEDLEYAERQGWHKVVIDDLNTSIPFADLVLNSSVLARAEAYPQVKDTLLGPEYFILEDRFAETAWSPAPEGELEILLTFGGSDPTGLTIKAARKLADMALLDTRITIIFGPGYPAVETELLESLSADSPVPMRLCRAPEDLLPFFITCGLAICAGGRTIYELTSLGTPCLAVASAPHEVEVVEAFEKRGMILAGMPGWDDGKFAEAVRKIVHEDHRSQLRGVKAAS